MFEPSAGFASAGLMRGRFAPDQRFAAGRDLDPGGGEAVDPVELARAEGHAAGRAEAQAEAAELAQRNSAAFGAIEEAFARLDAAQEEVLRRRLHETVAALCEATLAPLALDAEALARRAAKAADMLSRADDDRILRMHPDDIVLVGTRLPADLPLIHDATLERGTVVVETPGGGVEDGPGTWRRAVAEALERC
jgi:flagellar assembly protein FliH